MLRNIGLLVVAAMMWSEDAVAQYNADSVSRAALNVLPLLGQSNDIPDGYTLRITGAVPPANPDQSSGAISLGMGGLFEVSYRHEGLLGSPIGHLAPSNEIGVHLQILPQRLGHTSISVFFNTMTETQHNIMASTDLAANLPGIYNMAVESMTYDAKTTAAGLTFSSAINEMLSVSGSLGLREVWWKQQFTKYRIPMPLPTTSEGWTYPLGEQTSYNLNWSAALAFQPFLQGTFLVEVHTLPFMDIDESTYLLTPRQGIEAAFGIRYTLTLGINLLLYDRWYSEGGTRTHYHEIRFGIAVDLGSFPSD